MSKFKVRIVHNWNTLVSPTVRLQNSRPCTVVVLTHYLMVRRCSPWRTDKPIIQTGVHPLIETILPKPRWVLYLGVLKSDVQYYYNQRWTLGQRDTRSTAVGTFAGPLLNNGWACSACSWKKGEERYTQLEDTLSIAWMLAHCCCCFSMTLHYEVKCLTNFIKTTWVHGWHVYAKHKQVLMQVQGLLKKADKQAINKYLR